MLRTHSRRLTSKKCSARLSEAIKLDFIDSNIPMYLIGAAHAHKTEAQVLLERLIAAGQRLVTDAEVLQEILHRYTGDVLRAEIAQNPTLISARDAVHIAVMERHGVHSILSFDADFDRRPGLQRIHTL